MVYSVVNDDHLDDAHWINKWATWLTCPKGEENTGDCVGMPYGRVKKNCL